MTTDKPKPLKVSGPNIPDKQRHTLKLEIRCPPALAVEARKLATERGITLAQILAAGVAALKETAQ